MTKHYRIFNGKIPLLNYRIGGTLFIGKVKETRGFDNTCRYCEPEMQIVFWDFRQHDYKIPMIDVIPQEIKDSLLRIQEEFSFLNPIFVFGNKPDTKSYRAICPVKVNVELNKDIVMQTPLIDRAFVRYYMFQGRKTIRLVPKNDVSVVHLKTLENNINVGEISAPHLFWLHALFPTIKLNYPNQDDHDLTGLTDTIYETVSW